MLIKIRAKFRPPSDSSEAKLVELGLKEEEDTYVWREIYINPAKINYFRPDFEEEGVVILGVGDTSFCTDTPMQKLMGIMGNITNLT